MSQGPALVDYGPLPGAAPIAAGRVLVVGFDATARAGLADRLDGLRVETLAQPADLAAALADVPGEQQSSAVAICFGPRVDDGHEITASLEALSVRDIPCPPVVVTGIAAAATTDLSATERIFYRSTSALSSSDLAAVIAAARQIGTPRDQGRPSSDDSAVEALDADLAACRDFESGVDPFTRALCTAIGAAHADIWIETAERGRLRSPRAGTMERSVGLDAGLVGFAARTGADLRTVDVGADPRFDPAVDQPPGIEPGPGLVSGLRGAITGRAVVITVYRRTGEPVFDDADTLFLTQLLARARPHLRRWAAAEKAQEAMVAGARSLYRPEALSDYLHGTPTEGDLLRTDPSWTRLTYRLLLGFMVLGLLFSILAQVGDYAEGPAVIRSGDRVEVTARQAGTVDEVLVAAHQTVAPGDLLVRFHSPGKAAEVLRLEQEFALRLRQRLRDPGVRATEQELIASRSHLETARAQLDEFEVRAPTKGIVSDVRIRPGLHLGIGEVLLTLVTDESALSVLTLLAGEALPTLAPGQRIRLELTGYPGAHQDLRIAAVGQEVIGPAEARRSFGGAIADAVPIDGPVVLVEAALTSATFKNDGRVLTLHDGMHGRAEVKTRSRSLLLHLIPGLESLFQGHGHG